MKPEKRRTSIAYTQEIRPRQSRELAVTIGLGNTLQANKFIGLLERVTVLVPFGPTLEENLYICIASRVAQLQTEPESSEEGLRSTS